MRTLTRTPDAVGRSSEAQLRPSFLGQLARATLRHRKLVITAWAVTFIVGAFAASHVSGRLSVDFSLPGQPGYVTAEKILATYHNGGDNTPSILVVAAPRGQDIASQEPAIAGAFAKLRQEMPRLRVVDYGVTRDRAFITAGGGATFAMLFEPPITSFGTDTVATHAEALVTRALPQDHVGLTGLGQLEAGTSSNGPAVFTETLIGAAGALVVLAFVFASFLAFVPLVVAAVSILTTLLVVLGLTYLTEVSFIVEFLVALVGLGIAIDYSLLLVTRWREERARRRGQPRCCGQGGRNRRPLCGPLRHHCCHRPHGAHSAPRSGPSFHGHWRDAHTSGFDPRGGYPFAGPPRGHRTSSGLAAPAQRGPCQPSLERVGGPGHQAPVCGRPPRPGRARDCGPPRVWVEGGRDIGLGVLEDRPRPLRLRNAGPRRRTRWRAHAPGNPHDQAGGARRPRPLAQRARDNYGRPALGPTGSRAGTSDIIVIPAEETVNDTTLAPVTTVETRLAHEPGVLGVTGAGPIEQDYSHAVFGHFPEMFAVIALLTFLLLARAFRSAVLAAKAVLLNLLSLAATFGVLTWFWQEGHGSQAIFGIPATGAITFWVPLMIFAFLFGLSMDYEVFILSRVREEYDRTGNTNEAVVEGLGRTGRLVTCAALILFLAFMSLASAPDTDIKVLATGLGAGIVLDATLIRAFLVPALVALLGRWNWWMPRPLGRALLLPPEPKQPGPKQIALADA